MTAAEKKRIELKKKLDAKNGVEEAAALDPVEMMKVTEDRLAEIDRQDNKGKTWDPANKVFKGNHVGEDTVALAPVKLCKAVNMDTQGSMTAAEKAKLSAMVRTRTPPFCSLPTTLPTNPLLSPNLRSETPRRSP
jgi:hypothetical protein